jgi:hypothetical protein
MRYDDRTIPGTPHELTGPTPRTVRLAGNGLVFGILFASLLVLATVAIPSFCIHAVNQTHYRDALRSDGHDAIGVITKLRFGGRASMPSVKYTFNAEGKTFTGRALLSSDDQVRLDKSGPIAIRFLPTDPTINHPAGWEWSVLMEMPPIAILMLFGTCGAIYMTVLWRERKLARRGKPTAGVVANCVRKNRTYWVEYRFSTEDGAQVGGRGYYSTHREPNTGIWILYLPQNPSRNGPYPLPNYRVCG